MHRTAERTHARSQVALGEPDPTDPELFDASRTVYEARSHASLSVPLHRQSQPHARTHADAVWLGAHGSTATHGLAQGYSAPPQVIASDFLLPEDLSRCAPRSPQSVSAEHTPWEGVSEYRMVLRRVLRTAQPPLPVLAAALARTAHAARMCT